ncbi:39122_t:CDS:1, partial [Gigaspora margarita]
QTLGKSESGSKFEPDSNSNYFTTQSGSSSNIKLLAWFESSLSPVRRFESGPKVRNPM